MLLKYAQVLRCNAAPFIFVDGVGLIDTRDDDTVTETFYRVIAGKKIACVHLIAPRWRWAKDLHRDLLLQPYLPEATTTAH